MGLLMCLAIGLLAMASGLKPFGTERVEFWRESSRGVSTLAYFLGKFVSNLPFHFTTPLLFIRFLIQKQKIMESFKNE